MVRGRTRTAEPETLEDNGLNLKALKEKKISDLALIGKNFNIEGAANMRKQELIFAILQAQTEQNGHIYGEGVLETLPDGFGFLRAPDYNYLHNLGVSTEKMRCRQNITNVPSRV